MNKKRKTIAVIIGGIAILSALLFADYAYQSVGGGYFITHNNGDGTWDYVYSADAINNTADVEAHGEGLTTQEMNNLFNNYGCEPGTGQQVMDGLGVYEG